jgi:hypothetical protein
MTRWIRNLFGRLGSMSRLAVIGLSLLLLLAAVRIYPQLIPWGVSPIKFILASEYGATVRTPSGDRKIVLIHQIRWHPGLHMFRNPESFEHPSPGLNYWTWVVEDHWLFGPRVISQGYVSGARIRDGGLSASFSKGRLSIPFEDSAVPKSFSRTEADGGVLEAVKERPARWYSRKERFT